MNTPKRIDLDIKEIEALLQRVAEGSLQDGDYEIIKAMADTIVFLDQAVNDKATSIKRLLRMLFGDKTEKAKNILNPPDEKDSEAADKSSDDDDENGIGKNPNHQPKKKTKTKKKQKGHGRKKAEAYTGADKKIISHPDLKHGEPCPLCQKGKVYEQAKPGVVVRIRGNAPLQGTIYELQKLRCNLCGQIFTAEIPEQSTDHKYDETAKAIIPLLKYGSGIPFYRLEKLQESLGIPLSETNGVKSTIDPWEIKCYMLQHVTST